MIKEEDLILIKGSQGIRMEKIAEEIMAHPEMKEEFLVRQDAIWKRLCVLPRLDGSDCA